MVRRSLCLCATVYACVAAAAAQCCCCCHDDDDDEGEVMTAAQVDGRRWA